MFKNFSKVVHAQYEKMQQHELYSVDVLDIFETYLNAFPEGTNPIFRERTEHDCNCCKQFIRRVGSTVAIIDDKIVTVWDNYADLEYPYNVVSEALYKVVSQAPIRSVFRTKENQYSTEHTIDNQIFGHVWNHFFAKIDRKHKHNNPASVIGNFDTSAGVFRRGLNEITIDALESVISLIESDSIYRGEEHLASVKEFYAAKKQYDKNPSDVFIWKNVTDYGITRFKNTVIGTLLTDLSTDVPLEDAVKMFESKVAPTNYKRTKSLITPKMIEQAVDKIRELDLEGALNRRYAKIDDVTVNNVLFVDNDVRAVMKDSLIDSLMSSTKTKKSKPSVSGQDIGIEDFLSDVLPKAKSIKVLVKNDHLGNFMSLTTSDDKNNLFQWDNNFAWSYDGEVADSIKARVKSAGGKVDGCTLRVSLAWFNGDDLDIHCIDPRGNQIHFGNRMNILDVDMNAGHAANSKNPVENLSWTYKNIPDGDYKIYVHNYSKRSSENVGFILEVENDGKITQYHHEDAIGSNARKGHITITIKNNLIANTKIGDKDLKNKMSSTEKWGISTETLVDVDSIMLSPNHWDANKSGNKHWFFFLKNCKNPDKTRGIYNEFLRGDLTQHRKVFEVLGDKTKCAESDNQLSGVGFSSTIRNELTVLVTTDSGNKSYNIKF